MFFLMKPGVSQVRRLLEAQAQLDFSYAAVGATRSRPPDGYAVDRCRTCLGEGRDVFERAVSAFRRWQQFDLGWVQLCWPDAPIEPGRVVAVLSQTFGLWSLNVCRIVYVVDEEEPARKFGFAYGTLPEHAESGEERFVIELDPGDDSVWYDVLAFSRPNHFLTRAGYPLARRIQKRFARDSAAAMSRAVKLPERTLP